MVCHPHPLYGGEMGNNVVSAIETGFSQNGFTTLRFNFRGVGASTGAYDDGNGEVRDVLAALVYLKEHLDRDAYVVLAGYSFGAWMASKAAYAEEGIDALFLVSFPFAFYSTEELEAFRKPIYLVGGTEDEIGPLEDLLRVYKNFEQTEKNVKIITTDHFYGGKEKEIAAFVSQQIPLP